MKSIIRFFAVLVAVMLSATVMVSCGGSEDSEEDLDQSIATQMLKGKWNLVSVDKDFAAEYADIFIVPEWIEFQAGNKGKYELNGESVDGQWLVDNPELIGSHLTLHPDAHMDLNKYKTYTIKDVTKTKLVLQQESPSIGSITATYQKK